MTDSPLVAVGGANDPATARPIRVQRRWLPIVTPHLPEPDVKVVLVVVPALNEAPSVGRVVNEIRLQGFECVVIDDGSSDQTGVVARLAGATVLGHPFTLGQGAALQTGIEWALAHGADAIVTFDADGQHRAVDIPPLLEALSRNDADFALGSRFLGAAVNLPRSRRLLLQAALRFTRLTTRLHLTDTHNGLRAMTRRGASVIHIRQNRMAHASEILHQIARSRLRWVEVPVTVEYSDGTLAKGQKTAGSLEIMVDLMMDGLQR